MAQRQIEVPFDEHDIDDILLSIGINPPDSIYIDNQKRKAKQNLVELGKFFIEEILDVKKNSGEIEKSDIEREIMIKFPEIASKKVDDSKEIMDKRFKELDKLDDKI